GKAQFYTWLCRIAINVACDLRGRRRRVVLSLQGDHAVGLPDPSDCRPERTLGGAEEEHRIQGALDRLSIEPRTVEVLQGVAGQKTQKIAKVLGIPVGTVRSRLHRARLELRELLQEGSHPVWDRAEVRQREVPAPGNSRAGNSRAARDGRKKRFGQRPTAPSPPPKSLKS